MLCWLSMDNISDDPLPPSLPQLKHTELATQAGGGHGDSTGAGCAEIPEASPDPVGRHAGLDAGARV